MRGISGVCFVDVDILCAVVLAVPEAIYVAAAVDVGFLLCFRC